KNVIPPKFNEAHSFKKGIARVHEGGELKQFETHQPPEWIGGDWIGIDKTGADATLPFKADAERAKAAIVRLIRAPADLFVNNPDPNQLEKLALEPWDLEEPHQFSWGGFVIDVKAKTYSLDLIGQHDSYFYRGEFAVDIANKWTAREP